MASVDRTELSRARTAVAAPARHLLAVTTLAVATTAAAGLLASAEAASHGGQSETAGAEARPIDPGRMGKSDAAKVTRAIAVLHPTQGHEVHGTVHFVQSDSGDGLTVRSDVRGLPGKAHAHHVHLYGDCSGADGKSAGTHFNLAGSSKDPAEEIDRITGDLGNLEADGEGRAEASMKLDEGTLAGPYSLIGRSVVVHADPNDPAKPPIGGAGPRLACGVIGIDAADEDA